MGVCKISRKDIPTHRNISKKLSATNTVAKKLATEEDQTTMNPFRPPTISRSVAASSAASSSLALDRSLFSKKVNLAAASIADNKKIAEWRRALQKTREVLIVERIQVVRPHPDGSLAARGAKCLLLDPKVKVAVPETWSAALRSAVESNELGLVPFELTLDYDYWLYGRQHYHTTGYSKVGNKTK